jgi:hypothetical protein
MVQDSFWDHHRASEIQPSIKIHGTSLAQNPLNIGLAINLATEIKEIRVHCFMAALLVFAITLLVAVFLSELAQRSVLSTAVLFVLAGFIAGPREV